MRYFIFILFIFSTGPSLASALDPTKLYGERIEFDVIREGKVVGEHITSFEKNGDAVTVTSRMNIDIFVLFLPVYAFDYQTTETWTSGQLTNLKVNVVDGSDRLAFHANRKRSDLAVLLEDRSYTIEGQIFATNHWNANVVNDRQVLNTLTGNVNDIIVTPKGAETIDVSGGQITANRYDYSGDLTDTSVWYDDQGRWVKLQFLARDGSIIKYLCRTCQAGIKQ